MRRKSAFLILFVCAAAGCDKSTPSTPSGPAPATATQEPAKPAEAAPAKPGEPDYAAMKDDEWCAAAHSDTVKIVEAMKATMKKAGVEDGPDDYAPPEKARYLELCGKLPTPMQKCLVVGYSARNRQDCQSVLDGLDADAKAAYAELMGK